MDDLELKVFISLANGLARDLAMELINTRRAIKTVLPSLRELYDWDDYVTLREAIEILQAVLPKES